MVTSRFTYPVATIEVTEIPVIVPPVSIIPNSTISTELPSVCKRILEVLIFEPCFIDIVYSADVNVVTSIESTIVAELDDIVVEDVETGRATHEAVVPFDSRYFPVVPEF